MSIRKRWILLFALVLVLPPGLYFLGSAFAEGPNDETSSTATLLLKKDKPTLLRGESAEPEMKFEVFQKTQIAILKSTFVLKPALYDREVGRLKAFSGTDPMKELRDRLVVESYPDSEIFEVRYKHSDPKVAAAVVRAVVQSYVAVASDEERRGTLARVEALKGLRRTYQDKLKVMRTSLGEKRISGAEEPAADDADRFRAARADLDRLELNKADLSTRIAAAKSRNEKRDELADQLAGVEVQLDVVKKRIDEMGRRRTRTIDVADEEDEIRLGRETADKLGREIERLEVELHAPSRIMIVNLPD